ncbi:MAG: efflux RND transporter periplasmic adaptor subunit, partial [Thioalkalivibrio sp.]|nr:efflux RND transporter periplasmic adaptor subunit [Thioalkalivibrio sp.]
MTRVVLGLLILGALIAAGAVVWLDRDAPATGATAAANVRPVPVETAETEPRDLVRRLYVSGSLEASS